MNNEEELVDSYIEGKLEYQRDNVLLVVEDIEGSMVITHTTMDAEDVFQLMVFLGGKLAKYTGLSYNEVISDLREKEGE